jgi:hypothetical protein
MRHFFWVGNSINDDDDDMENRRREEKLDVICLDGVKVGGSVVKLVTPP